MGPAISEVLPLAVGVLISPVAVIAVILVLFSARARTNAPAFVIGWALGLAVVAAVVYLVCDALDVATDTTASDGTSTGKMILGVVLVLMAVRRLRDRPAAGETAPLPKWMLALDDLTPVKAGGLGALLGAVNPKNLLLTVGAAAGVAQLGGSTVDAAVGLAVFVVVASLGVALPVVVYFVAGDRAQRTLDPWRAWLEHNHVTVMAVVLLVLGVVLFAKGLGPITA